MKTPLVQPCRIPVAPEIMRGSPLRAIDLLRSED